MPKKTKKSKRRVRGYTIVNSSRLTLIEPRMLVTLKWYAVGSFSLATVTASNQFFNLNSLFEPITGNAHQPMGYDQVVAFYNRYRVDKTAWKVNFMTSSSDYFGCVTASNGAVNTVPTTQNTFQTVCEYQRSRRVAVSSNANTKTISGSIMLNVLNGSLIREYRADNRFQAVVTASPTEALYVYVSAYNPSGGTITVNYDIELHYTAEVWDPIQLPGS